MPLDASATLARPRRFVVQHHTGYGPEHWDLMLEEDDGLATWRLHRDPATLAAGPIPATRIADHRKAYLTYEGPVSRDRGQVRIVDHGTYAVVSYEAASVTADFGGVHLAGRLVLRRSPADTTEWTLGPA